MLEFLLIAGILIFGGLLFAWVWSFRRKKISELWFAAGLTVTLMLLLPSLGALFMAHWMILDSPLYCAASRGDVKTVRAFLRLGAEPEQKFGCYDSALTQAAREGHTEIVRLLLQNGADPNTVDEGEMTPLKAAKINCHREVVELLKQAGARN